MRNVLFYSVHCPLCRDLIVLLKNEQFIQYFKLYCVDDNLEKCPVRIVPTALVNGIRKPLEGKETLKWVQQAKFIRQQWINNMKQSVIHHNMMKMMMQNLSGPLGYSDQEMGGFSDGFAYTDVDKAIAHVFFGYGQDNKNAIFTAEEFNKIREGESDHLIKKLESMRKEQDTGNEDMYEKQQLVALIQHERESSIDTNPINDEERMKMLMQQQMIMQQMKMNNGNGVGWNGYK